MSEPSQVEVLGPEQRDEAVEVLCTAFSNYPVFRFALQDAGANYARGLEALIGHFTDTRLATGCPVLGIRSGTALVAAANVNPAKPPPAPEDAAERWARVGRVAGAATLKRFELFGNACQELAPAGHFTYLGMIGVRPEYQGGGHGAAMLRYLTEGSLQDPNSEGVLLTTETAENVRYYEKHGYEVVDKAQVEELETWTMLRRDELSP